jgi:hypothetical protein
VNEGQPTVPPLIAQVAGPVWLAIDHVTPGPVRNGSVNVTPDADAFPPFVTVILKPIGDPALTELASAVLVMVNFGQLTVSEADALLLVGLALVLLNVAVLSYAPQLFAVV